MRCQRAQTLHSIAISGLKQGPSPTPLCGQGRWHSLVPSRAFATTRIRHSTSKFTYHAAAAFSAKDRTFNPSRHFARHDASSNSLFVPSSKGLQRLPTNVRPSSGQDCFFISNVNDGGCIAFGIADGVGGWSDSGIDSADFSHGICESMAEIAGHFRPDQKTARLRARDLIEGGYDKVARERGLAGGGTTACVGIARPEGVLEVANLGDSGFVQLRLNAVNHQSEPQTHAFNTPYQLSLISPKMLARSRLFGGSMLQDLPKDASVTSHEVRHGDILVFASDGVWDNLSSQDLLRSVSAFMKAFGAWTASEEGVTVGRPLKDLTNDLGRSSMADHNLQSLLATLIADQAKQASVNTKVDGPFAREVKRNYPFENYRGGKVDDICVVVAVVVEDPPSQ